MICVLSELTDLKLCNLATVLEGFYAEVDEFKLAQILPEDSIASADAGFSKGID